MPRDVRMEAMDEVLDGLGQLADSIRQHYLDDAGQAPAAELPAAPEDAPPAVEESEDMYQG